MTTATARDNLLVGRGISGGYGRRAVLHDVDIELHRGEVVALLGPNGAGKTTLMKMLVGLLDPRTGTVDGPTGRRVGWVPQGGAIYARMTVRENLELFARLMKLPGTISDVARDAARGANLEPWYDALGSELSGGLRQRLNVAVGLLGDPELLVLDEPTTGVDLVHRTATFHVLRERATRGCSVLFSTHSIEDAASADRIVTVVGGRIVFDGLLADMAAIPAVDDGQPDPGRHAADPVSAGLLRLWAEHGYGHEAMH
ncbi:MAG: ABC transporter ATP-binding protein [Gaiellales bacterium]